MEHTVDKMLQVLEASAEQIAAETARAHSFIGKFLTLVIDECPDPIFFSVLADFFHDKGDEYRADIAAFLGGSLLVMIDLFNADMAAKGEAGEL